MKIVFRDVSDMRFAKKQRLSGPPKNGLLALDVNLPLSVEPMGNESLQAIASGCAQSLLMPHSFIGVLNRRLDLFQMVPKKALMEAASLPGWA